MIRKIWLSLAAAALVANVATAQDSNTAQADFLGLGGSESGRATMTEGAGGVLFEIEVSGLPPRKWVALHIHETGACDPTSSHESAGGHFNPDEKEHGFLAANGPHAGDMPNQYVGDDGVMRAQVFNGMVTLKEGDRSIRGRAIVVHAGFDDYRTGPAGGAGDRLACAVIQ
ncbi:superoxide dismutase family protein [Mycoplana rhizolycopersici]|jgi:Cu-Zn family superoxide dismutase|uniref:Superoxide dismutase [Cu-Zn] n=1 Tax=Mycoplana rhizolycopersici TaxID=2746702 RepID=A0ABX2QCZ6_9HYPH|nr:superoxide dismutase family protein [Rhizobium rhizolycopersici]NVP54299.1 superoxide dismutase family protein [Rhizobium rhizolycopersici]